jgi:uncharacterized protein YrrD
MLISFNKIINLPLYFEDKKIGLVLDVIIDPEKGLFLYLILNNNRYLEAKDVKEFLNNKVVIKNDKNINKIKKKYKNIIINNKVYTLSGEKLGKVSDFEIDLSTDRLSKIYVSGGNIIKNLIRGELIINKDQIISISEDKIIVENIIARKKQKNKILPEGEKELVGASFCIKS